MIWRTWTARAALLAVAAQLTACDDAQGTESVPADASIEVDVSAEAAATASAATAAGGPSPEELAGWDTCRARIEQAKAQPAVVGSPAYEKQRVHMARVRGQGLLWKQVPAGGEEVTARIDKGKRYEHKLDAVRRLIRKNKKKAERRAVFLRDGYLYADDPVVGLALVETLGLTQLFDEEKIFLQRGAHVQELHRKDKTRWKPERYVYTEGPYEGRYAELLLGDRLALKREDLAAGTLAVDIQDMQERGRFDRLRPVHLSEAALVADVRYGADVWVPTLFELDGQRGTEACQALSPELAASKKAYLAETDVHHRAMARLRTVVRAMVNEEIPFDADTGQSNGFLRKEWRRAYLAGWRRFTHDDKKYDVYTLDGQARPPQVCIDFLTDAWERASGTWWTPMEGDPPKPSPKRTAGEIDFDKLSIDNRRSVAEFTKFAESHPEHFEVWEIPKEKRIAFEEREVFFTYLAEIADNLRPGDMVSIHGYKQGGRPHYHSIMLLEMDPITGIPTLVAGNAVLPREQTLEGVMHISPQRSWRHRIRVKGAWLEAVAKASADEEAAAPSGG